MHLEIQAVVFAEVLLFLAGCSLYVLPWTLNINALLHIRQTDGLFARQHYPCSCIVHSPTFPVQASQPLSGLGAAFLEIPWSDEAQVPSEVIG